MAWNVANRWEERAVRPGDTEGYFLPHTFEVTEALGDRSEHALAVEVTCSPHKAGAPRRNLTGAFQGAAYLPPDWNPGGIWRPVGLERTGPVRVRHLRVLCVDADEASATVSLRAVLDAAGAAEITLRSAVGDTELLSQRRVAAGENQVEWQLRIDEPELWWPHALGGQPLYDVDLEVLVDGQVSDIRAWRTGLRHVRMDGFRFRVNGEQLFLKGAALGPTGFGYLAIFCLARLFAAVGLWIRASWGAVLLLGATGAELALYLAGSPDVEISAFGFVVRLLLLASLVFIFVLNLRQRRVHD